MSVRRTCEYPNCEDFAFGFCSKHSMKRVQILLYSPNKADGKCEHENCGKASLPHGERFCSEHRIQVLRTFDLVDHLKFSLCGTEITHDGGSYSCISFTFGKDKCPKHTEKAVQKRSETSLAPEQAAKIRCQWQHCMSGEASAYQRDVTKYAFLRHLGGSTNQKDFQTVLLCTNHALEPETNCNCEWPHCGDTGSRCLPYDLIQGPFKITIKDSSKQTSLCEFHYREAIGKLAMQCRNDYCIDQDLKVILYCADCLNCQICCTCEGKRFVYRYACPKHFHSCH
jgi:hypothetical protein